MANAHNSDVYLGNKLLARLGNEDIERLRPHMQLVPLEFNQVLYEVHSAIQYSYFPISGALSAVTVMTDGHLIEVATIGNEGILGLPAFIEAGTAPNRVVVQIAGDGLRMSARVLLEESRQNERLRKLLVLYQSAFHYQVSQSVACNGLHPVQQRCCRWLLITHDRLNSDELPLTHEYLSVMLGVRRASVSEVLQSLQEKGLVHSGRGVITVVDRSGLEAGSCECYRQVADEFKRLLG